MLMDNMFFSPLTKRRDCNRPANNRIFTLSLFVLLLSKYNYLRAKLKAAHGQRKHKF